MITLNAIKRDAKSKSENNTLRRTGYIPFVIYSKGDTSTTGAIPTVEMEAALRTMRPGFLPTTIFTLQDSESGKTRRVLVKDIQYKPTTYQVIHLDFLELIDDRKVDVKVPVEFLNSVDCVGVKLGGFLRHTMRHIKVTCLPKDIPSHFELDVKELDINQTRKVKDIIIPERVQCLAQPNDVVVAVVKR